PGGLHAVPGGGVPGGQQELPGDDAVRDAVVDRLASSHDARGSGPPVRDPGTEAASRRDSGADVGSDGAAPAGGAGGARAEAATGDGAGGIPRASQRGRPEVTCQDVAGPTPGRQIPAAVEVALEQKTGSKGLSSRFRITCKSYNNFMRRGCHGRYP